MFAAAKAQSGAALVAAAALAAASAALLTKLAVGDWRRRRRAPAIDGACGRYEIPGALLSDGCRYREEVALAVRLALEGGLIAPRVNRVSLRRTNALWYTLIMYIFIYALLQLVPS